MELHKYFTSLFTIAPAEDAGKVDSPAESCLRVVELDEVILNPSTLVSVMDCWAIASEWLLSDVSLHLSFCLLQFLLSLFILFHFFVTLIFPDGWRRYNVQILWSQAGKWEQNVRKKRSRRKNETFWKEATEKFTVGVSSWNNNIIEVAEFFSTQSWHKYSVILTFTFISTTTSLLTVGASW